MLPCVEAAKKIADDIKVTFLYIITNDAQLMDSVMDSMPKLQKIVATSDSELSKLLRDKEITVKKLSNPHMKGIDILGQAKDLLVRRRRHGYNKYKGQCKGQNRPQNTGSYI
jgi:hypothetical protein